MLRAAIHAARSISGHMGSAPTNAARGTGTRFKMASGRTVRQDVSDINALSDARGIFEFEAKITHCAVDIRMTKQQLHRAQVACLAVNLRRFCTAKGMRAVTTWFKANCRHPIAHEPAVLAGGDVQPIMEPAGEDKAAGKHLGRFDPRQDGIACVFGQFKLHRSLGLALDHRNALWHAIIFYPVRHRQSGKITAAQLAIDGDLEQSQIAQIARAFEPCPDCPN